MGRPSGPHLRLHHVALFVSDLERSRRFLAGQLGFTVVLDAEMARGRFVAVAPPDGTALIGLVAPRPDMPEHALIGHSARVVFVTDDIDAKYTEWAARGVSFRHPPQPSDWGGIVAPFQDPDGNPMALISHDAMTREVEEQQRTAAAREEAAHRAAHELEIARQVQARLLPQSRPASAGLDYAGVCVQARAVGGDYYDFLPLGRDRVGFVIGDISGKGMGAALLMANLQASLRSQAALALEDPGRFLSCVNRHFFESTTPGAYASLFFAEYEEATGRLRYANCGHPPALLLRGDGRLEELSPTTTVVGLFGEWDCPSAETGLAPGDTLLLYTDGVTERFDASGQEFGRDRLIAALRRGRHLPAASLLDGLVAELHAFGTEEHQDDVTLIAVRRKA